MRIACGVQWQREEWPRGYTPQSQMHRGGILLPSETNPLSTEDYNPMML